MNNNKIIMIIDDDPDDRDVFFEILGQIDPEYDCLCGKDGVEGLVKLSLLTFLPTFIFLDLNMPKMNGKEFLIEIKRIGKLQNIPVVIYSTSKHEADIKDTMKLGASYYMTKPNLFSDLHNAVAEILTNRGGGTKYVRKF